MRAFTSLAIRWRTTPGAAAFIVLLGVVAAGLSAISVSAGVVVPPHELAEFWVLAGLAVIADLGSVRRLRGEGQAGIFVSVCFTFVIMLLWGVGAAVVVQTLATAGAAWRGRLGVSGAILTWPQFVCSLAVAGLVLQRLGSTEFQIDVHINYTNIGTVLLPALAWLATNQLIGTIAARLRDRTWRSLKSSAASYQLLITSGLILIGPVLMSEPTGLMTLLVVVPLLAVNWAARRFGEQEHRMVRDPVTGLLNRRGLMVELSSHPIPDLQDVPEERSSGREVVLLLVGLDELGQVSSMVGRGVHDEMLVLIGQRLTETVDGRALIGLISEDEFAVVTMGTGNQRAAVALGSEICRSLSPPAFVRGVPFDMSATVGIARVAPT